MQGGFETNIYFPNYYEYNTYGTSYSNIRPLLSFFLKFKVY